MVQPASPLNWIYLGYTVVALFLSYKNVAATLRVPRRHRDMFFLASRTGTFLMTGFTTLDNLRIWLGGFTSLLYPQYILTADNATGATLLWEDMDFQGAGFATSTFWVCNFAHIVGAVFGLYTLVYVFLQLHYEPTENEPLIPPDASRKVFICASVVLFSFAILQFYGLVAGPILGPHGGALKLEDKLQGAYIVTTVDKSPIFDGLIAVILYSFSTLFLGIYMYVRRARQEGCSTCSKTSLQNLLWLFMVTVAVMLISGTGNAKHGVLTVLPNLSEQMFFALLLWLDITLAERSNSLAEQAYLSL